MHEHGCMSHGTCEWVMSHTCESCVEWVMSHTCMIAGVWVMAHTSESWHMGISHGTWEWRHGSWERVMSHTWTMCWTSHVSHVYYLRSRRSTSHGASKWVMAHGNESWHIKTSHGTWEWVLSHTCTMGWLQLVSSLKLQVYFAECSLFYRALLHKFAQASCDFKEPANRSHPIPWVYESWHT